MIQVNDANEVIDNETNEVLGFFLRSEEPDNELLWFAPSNEFMFSLDDLEHISRLLETANHHLIQSKKLNRI